MSPPRLLIAGGGTGGHLFPALAVAEAWEQQPGGATLFVGTPQGLEARLLPEQGKALALLRVGRLKGGGPLARLATLAGLPLALWQALSIVRGYRPDVVLGVGGYASAPAVVAAWLLGIPVAIHEQNAIPGLTNRWLGRLAQRVFVSFPGLEGHFSGKQVVFTGNPVRQALLAAADHPPERDYPGDFHLLVFGGSLGAAIFGQVVPEAVARLAEEGLPIQVTQQARGEELETLRASYRQKNIAAAVTAFIQDMATAYRQADLVICRAGATSIAELAVMGRAALLVPYPHAADDHQTANAKALVHQGGAWAVGQEAFTTSWLVEFLRERYHHRSSLSDTGVKAASLAKPEAARTMAEQLRQLAAKEQGNV